MGYALFFGVLFLIAVASYFISTGIYKRLVRSGNTRAFTISIRVVAFIVSYLLIAATIFYLIMRNVRLER